MPLRKANKTISREMAIRKVAESLDLKYPERASGRRALIELNEIYLKDPTSKVSEWYIRSPDSEIKHFIDAWNEWRKKIIYKRRELRFTMGGDSADELGYQTILAMLTEKAGAK